MSIAILGVNHKTAPIALREKVAFTSEKLEKALYNLNQHPLISGCVILSTCNRTELYLSVEHVSDLVPIQYTVNAWLCEFHDVEPIEFKTTLYWYVNEKAASHLMRVACGIDSLILGESQILGQVKKAYTIATKSMNISAELTKLFQRAFHVAKRVRSTTQIGSNTASIAYASCLVTRQSFTKMENLTVLLIGAGETIELVLRYLKQHSIKKVIIANRTRENALKLAVGIDAEIISLPEIALRLKEADLIISSTASPLPIIGKGLVERSLIARQHRKLLFIDLAVPRDIEIEVNQLEDVTVVTIDDLQDLVNSNLAKREIAAKEAEYIIQTEAARFIHWLRSRNAINFVKAYRNHAEKIKFDLENKAIKAIKRGADINDVIEQLSHRLTNRLIHAPTQSLLHAATNDDDYLKILSESLGLKKQP